MASVSSPVIAWGTVRRNRPLSGDAFLLEIECPDLPGAEPGQFVKARAWAPPEAGGSPFLDRPFSIHEQNASALSLLCRTLGPATEILSRVKEGGAVKISGPLGRGLEAAMGESAPLYLVGGGAGLAPMRLAAKWAAPHPATIFYGERSGAAQVDEAWLKSWGPDFRAVTEDGSGYGEKGLATAPLEAALKKEPRQIFACGPAPMLAAAADLGAKYGVRVWASVEAGMACGFGVCLSCSLPLAGGGRFRACQEGPVVDASLVDWKGV